MIQDTTVRRRRRWSVIVVDDDEDMRELLGAILELDPRFELVGSATDGAEGFGLAVELNPAVVVVDLQMPGMDGLGALRLIREHVPHTRIVVVSAFPDPYTLVDVLSLGADAYLDKSRTYAELIPVLAALCETVERSPVGRPG